MSKERGNLEQRVMLLEGRVRELLREVRRLAAGGTPTRSILQRAILNEELPPGGSASADVYTWTRDGSDILIGTYDVHDFLGSGDPLPAETWVAEALMGFRHYVITAGCDVGERPEEPE